MPHLGVDRICGLLVHGFDAFFLPSSPRVSCCGVGVMAISSCEDNFTQFQSSPKSWRQLQWLHHATPCYTQFQLPISKKRRLEKCHLNSLPLFYRPPRRTWARRVPRAVGVLRERNRPRVLLHSELSDVSSSVLLDAKITCLKTRKPTPEKIKVLSGGKPRQQKKTDETSWSTLGRFESKRTSRL